MSGIPFTLHIQVLKQVSPQQNNSLCQEALKYPKRNRSEKYLPGVLCCYANLDDFIFIPMYVLYR